MKSFMKMIGLAALVLFSLTLPRTASAAITCNQAYPAPGFSGWPYNQYTQYCGTATLKNGTDMANALHQLPGYAMYEMARALPTFYVFETAAEYKTYASANGLTYVAPVDNNSFGVTLFNAQKVPVYSAIFVENVGDTISGNVPHSTGQQAGAGINYLLGYVTNGGVLPPINISAGTNTANSKSDNVFQDQLTNTTGGDWETLNARTPCFDTAHNSNGVFSGYADSTSTDNPAKYNYICTGTNGLGTTLSASYAGKSNQAILAQAWPNIYGVGKGDALFAELVGALYLGNDGVTTSTPRSADTYLNSYFGCSRSMAATIANQALIGASFDSPNTCATPVIASSCLKVFSNPYQWPSGNVINCVGPNDPTANSIFTGLGHLGARRAGDSYTSIKQTFNAAEAYVYVFATTDAYTAAFTLAKVTSFAIESGGTGVTFSNNGMHYSILQESIVNNNQQNLVEAAGHELGHTLDAINGFPSGATSSTFGIAMQNDWLNLNYSVVGTTKANSTPRLACGTGGPLLGVIDPSYKVNGVKQPFCNGSTLDPNWSSTALISTILQSAGVTGADLLHINAARQVGTNPTITSPKGWLEWFAQSFAINADGDTGGGGVFVVDPVVSNNGYFACTAGTGLNGIPFGWLGYLYAGQTVSLPAKCTNPLPSWWTTIQ